MRRLALVVAVGLLLVGASLATAQEKTKPRQIVIGVAYIVLDSEYVMLTVNGESWEQFYYEDDGTTLVLEGVDRTQDYRIDLVPTYDELKPTTIKLSAKDWKLKRLDKETRQWQAHKKHKFAKWKAGEKEKFEADQLKRAEEEKKQAEAAAKKAEEEARKAEEEKRKAEEQPDAEKPADPPAENAEDKPADAPAENAEDKPADAPAEKVEEIPADAPAENAEEKPADAPAEKVEEKGKKDDS